MLDAAIWTVTASLVRLAAFPQITVTGREGPGAAHAAPGPFSLPGRRLDKRDLSIAWPLDAGDEPPLQLDPDGAVRGVLVQHLVSAAMGVSVVLADHTKGQVLFGSLAFEREAVDHGSPR